MRKEYKRPVAATIVEYSLMSGLIAVAMLVAVSTVGSNLSGVFGSAHGKVSLVTSAR